MIQLAGLTSSYFCFYDLQKRFTVFTTESPIDGMDPGSQQCDNFWIDLLEYEVTFIEEMLRS